MNQRGGGMLAERERERIEHFDAFAQARVHVSRDAFESVRTNVARDQAEMIGGSVRTDFGRHRVRPIEDGEEREWNSEEHALPIREWSETRSRGRAERSEFPGRCENRDSDHQKNGFARAMNAHQSEDDRAE